MTNYNYPGTFRQQGEYKERIRQRDNYTCQLCGATRGQVRQMDVDHIIPYHVSHDNSEDNLRVLCHSCNLIGRRYTIPEGRLPKIPTGQYLNYIKSELAFSANQGG